MSDLAYKLEVGEIKEIHIAEQNGRKVLRLECEKVEHSEYKTVHATKSAKKNQVTGVPASILDTAMREAGKKEKGLPRKLAEGAADFLFNPERNKGKKDMFSGRGPF